jgi:hypothetical protein
LLVVASRGDAGLGAKELPLQVDDQGARGEELSLARGKLDAGGDELVGCFGSGAQGMTEGSLRGQELGVHGITLSLG